MLKLPIHADAAKIARRSGLHVTTVYDLLAGRQPNLGVMTAAALARGLGCPLAAPLPNREGTRRHLRYLRRRRRAW